MEHLRMCIVCKARKDKSSLLRIVKSPDGIISIDRTGKAAGRGAYICGKECIQKAQKTRALNRAFKCEIKSQIYEELAETS